MSEVLPSLGRLAGVDFGTQRIGIAVSDAEQRLASPLANYSRRNLALDAAYFQQLVMQEAIVGLVVGLPVHMSGDESAKSLEARAFGQWLAETTLLPVAFHDERYSSAAADEFLTAGKMTAKQRQKRRDMLAAQVILASFLESSDRSGGRHSLDR